MLVRLLYASRAVDTSPAAIEAILTQSRQHNPGSGITGILCYGGGVFLQAIEGGRSAVNELYGHIQRDARHKNVELLHFEEIMSRKFADWSMGKVSFDRLNMAVLLKHSAKAVLDPYSVSGAVSVALIEELMQTAAVS